MSFLHPNPGDTRRRRFIVGGAAVVMTALVMTAFLLESRYGYLPPDKVIIYVQSWPADRSAAEVAADLAATQALRAAKLAESRAYVASLTGEARIKAQKQLDAYIAGNGGAKQFPYVAAPGTRLAVDPPPRVVAAAGARS